MKLNANYLCSKSIESVLFLLKQNNINENEVIFVGGILLESLGLRKANDIDVIVTPDKRKQLESNSTQTFRGPFEAINLSTEVQVLKNPYRLIGVSDEQCFRQELYNRVTFNNGSTANIIFSELEFGKKLFRKRSKDKQDIILLQRYALQVENWRWDLIPVSPLKPKKHIKQKQSKLSRCKTLLKKIINNAPKGVTQPRKSVRKIKQSVIKRFLKIQKTQKNKNIEKKITPSSLCNNVVDIGTLIQWQFKDKHFARYDTLLRNLVLNTYLEKINTNDKKQKTDNNSEIDRLFEYYDLMQSERVNRFSRLQFEELINSVQLKGFQTDKYPLKLDADGRLMDGSHRLACALGFGIDKLPVQFNYKKKGPTNYGREWFEERDFPENLLLKLDDQLKSLLLSTGAAFVLIIWPPAQKFSEEIIEMIKSRYPTIAETKNIRIKNFSKFIESVYLSDDIEQWKIQKKIYHMKEYKPVVTAIAFLISDPAYRTKTRTESYLSDTVAKLKKEIREKYRDQIDDYIYDIVAHIGDNPAMNRDIVKIMKTEQMMLI